MTDDDFPHLEQQAMLLDEWVEARRQAAAWEAKAAGLLAERFTLMEADIAEEPFHRDAIWRSMVAEYSAAGRVAKGSVEHAFTDARTLTVHFPALRESFEAGRVSGAHVREVISAASPVLSAIDAGTVEAEMLAVFEAVAVEFAESEAPARTRAHVRQVAAAIAGSTVVERHRTALAEQCVSIRAFDDQLSWIQALVPTYRAEAIMDRLTRLARHQKAHPEDRSPTFPETGPAPDPDGAPADAGEHAIFGEADTFTLDPFHASEPPVSRDWIPEPCDTDHPASAEAYLDAVRRALGNGPEVIQLSGDSRPLDQIRAEILTDMLLTAGPSDILGTGLENITARIQVTLAATTLAGIDDRPAQSGTGGTLDPDIARALAGMSTGWTRLFLNPQGLVTETDTYTPTEPMRRFLRARDEHCRFPGCRLPVHRCEIDHTRDHAKGGPTSTRNLAHLCKAHHVLKHPDIPDEHRWTARQLPDWSLEWTSPLGRTYLDRPPRRVMFTPTDTPAPDDAPGRPEMRAPF